jgi:diguanylate cyclase (GGDEF)-like protein
MTPTVRARRPVLAADLDATRREALDDTPTHLVQQILERRGRPTTDAPREHEDTTATVAVILRVQPPPYTLLSVDETARGRLQRLLEEAEFHVTVAHWGDAAVAALRERHHAFVLTDRLDLIRRVRELALPRLTQIMFLTGSRDFDVSMAMRAGADECLDADVIDAVLSTRFAAARRMSDLESALRASLVEGRRLATIDELTGVANRRFFARHFPREIARAARRGRALCVAMCDIDHFKRINDRAGHAAGDAVLRRFGARLQQVLRRGEDWVARLGGEEFAIVLPETDLEQGLLACRRMRDAVREAPFRASRVRIAVTASFGVTGLAVVPPEPRGLAQRLLGVADRALYRSKRDGRDRVVAVRLPETAN